MKQNINEPIEIVMNNIEISIFLINHDDDKSDSEPSGKFCWIISK